MKNIYFLLFGLIACFFCSCESDRIVRVENGMIHHAGGATTPIPHWDEEGWTHFFIVRHAEKANPIPAPSDPPGPPLSQQGEARATRLGEIMKRAGLDLVYKTDFIRTTETAKKVQAHYPNIPVPIDYVLTDAWLANQVSENRGKRIFVVGHQNTIPVIVEKLMGNDFRVLLSPGEKDFGKFYVVASRGIGDSELMSEVMFY